MSAEECEDVLNVSSTSHEELGRHLSNLAAFGFTLDGIHYASFESFYQSLKYQEAAKRREIARMDGWRAKKAGSQAGCAASTMTSYGGRPLLLGSPEHHALLKEALRQKFLQNKPLLRAFVASAGRPLAHSLAKPENPHTYLPGDVFVRMLTELRLEFLSPQ